MSGQLAHIELCKICGALVADGELHQRWHLQAGPCTAGAQDHWEDGPGAPPEVD
jgi:hypothetical protein